MLANYHTHTVRCKHAEGTEREYIEAAIKRGFKTLGFSDHVPQPYPERYVSSIRMSMSELPEYTSVLSKLKEEYKDRIEILIGFEAEYTRQYFKPLLKELCKYPLDYLILGQHYVPDELEGNYTGVPTDNEDRLKAYTEFVIEGMETGLFAYLAHPDLIYYTGPDRIYAKYMTKIIEASIELDIPLEINLYGLLDGRQYPCDRFFGLASQAGAKFVVGCDAHIPEMILGTGDVPALRRFLKRNNIAIGDNIVRLPADIKAKAAAYCKK